jgi:hypothetical protein
VRVAPLLLVVPLCVAVLAAGVLPPEHVHHRENAAAAVIHAHFESNHLDDQSDHVPDPHERSVSGSDHDSRETTLGVGQALVPSQTIRSDYAPSLLPGPVPFPGLSARYSTLGTACLELALPPPLRDSIPRAPPA